MNFRRKVAAFAATAVVVTGLPLVLQQAPAAAHGAFVNPPTRTYACFVNGGAGGELTPTNGACAEAVAIGGKQPLWDWYGVLIGNAAGRHQEIIPDGELCGAGTDKFAGFNLARADWPVTNLQSGAPITFRYNGWAPHPGTWSQYVTKDGFDPTQPLRWSDLEPEPFDEITNPPLSSGSTGAEYVWNARLPNKSGRHIIYSIWQRSDSAEAFYNCVDVNFTGGGSTQPTAGPNPSVTPTAEPTTEPTAEPTTEPTANPVASACTATYTIASAWNGGFQADVTVRNNGTTPLNGWTVSWTNPAGVTINNVWNAQSSVSGSTMTVKSPAQSAPLPANGSTSFGFIGAGTSGTPELTCASA